MKRIDFNVSVDSNPGITKHTIHNVYILDSSSSMSGSKWKSAVGMVNLDLAEQSNFQYSLVIFASRNRQIYWKLDIPEQIDAKSFTGGMTALTDAIYDTLTKAIKTQAKDEKVLVKIFTDGGENDSERKSSEARELIAECEAKGFTITFMGTERDVQTAIKLYGISESNTAVHENTAESIDKLLVENRKATAAYTMNVERGIDVTEGFYKTLSSND